MVILEGKTWGRDFLSRIVNEQFRIHSVFNTVCNLQSTLDEPLLSLVTKVEAQGPNTLWLDSINPLQGCAGEKILYSGNSLYCGGIRLDCNGVEVLPNSRVKVAGTLDTIRLVEDWLELQFPGITRPAAESIEKFCRGLGRHDLNLTVEALQDLIGSGEGLTPVGDDYSAGMLLGFLRGWKSSATSFKRNLAREVSRVATRTNSISQTMLWYAARGEGARYLTRVADGLLGANPQALQDALELSRIGSSSGRYLLAGILQGCKTFLTREYYYGTTDCG